MTLAKLPLLLTALGTAMMSGQSANPDVDKMILQRPGPYYIVEDTMGQVVGLGTGDRFARAPKSGLPNQLWNIVQYGTGYRLQNVSNNLFISLAWNGWHTGIDKEAVTIAFSWDSGKLMFMEQRTGAFFTVGSDVGPHGGGVTGTSQHFTFENVPPRPTVVKTVSAKVDVPDGQSSYVTVNCPAGSFPLSGGALTNNQSMVVYRSAPGDVSRPGAWDVSFTPLYSGAGAATIGAYAICGTAPGYEVVRSTTGTAMCPAGKRPMGGGGATPQTNSSLPLDFGWKIIGAQTDKATSAAICTTYLMLSTVTNTLTGTLAPYRAAFPSVSCPAGSILIGGGGYTKDSGILSLVGNAPGDGNVFNSQDNATWMATFINNSDGSVNVSAEVFGICMPNQ